jgi:hypothetical protein
VDAGCRRLTASWVRDRAASDHSIELCDSFEGLERAGPEVLLPCLCCRRQPRARLPVSPMTQSIHMSLKPKGYTWSCFDVRKKTSGPYLAALHGILVPVMACSEACSDACACVSFHGASPPPSGLFSAVPRERKTCWSLHTS